MPYYILIRKGRDGGYTRFHASGKNPKEEDIRASNMTHELIEEFERDLGTEHTFQLDKVAYTVPLGRRNYIHRPHKSVGELIKGLAKFGPAILKEKWRRRKLRKG